MDLTNSHFVLLPIGNTDHASGDQTLNSKRADTLKIGTPKEISEGEARVAMTPESASALQKLGHECLIEAGAGLAAGFSDEAYKAAGVEVVKTAAALWKGADIIAKVRPPNATEAKRLTEGKTLISFFYPAQNET